MSNLLVQGICKGLPIPPAACQARLELDRFGIVNLQGMHAAGHAGSFFSSAMQRVPLAELDAIILVASAYIYI